MSAAIPDPTPAAQPPDLEQSVIGALKSRPVSQEFANFGVLEGFLPQ